MPSFKSKVIIKILNYFFTNPEAKHYINELARILDLDPKNVDRKLKEMEREGLLKSEFVGNQRFFYLSKNYPLLSQYRQIFLKTYGMERLLKDILTQIQGVKEAYIFGSYAQNKMDASSDIDLLVVGNHSVLLLQKQLLKIQKEIGREINIVNLSEDELKSKKRARNPFIKNIFSQKIIKLL